MGFETGPDLGDRHLSADALREYMRAGAPALVRVNGSPAAYLVIDPRKNRLAIQVVMTGAMPDVTRYAHVAVSDVLRDGERYRELAIEGVDRLADVYPLLCLVLDHIQVERMEFASAVQEALRVYRNALAQRASLALRDEVGLVGELLTLEHLVHAIGPIDAVQAWQGPLNEEHDFVLPSCDLEVKCTSTEARHHWISSATQLTATPGRHLYLLSIQITRTSPTNGSSLLDLLKALHTRVEPARQKLDALLSGLGYDGSGEGPRGAAWRLRNAPVCFRIDVNFPALRRDALAAVVPEANRVLEYNYKLDLTGMDAVKPPEELIDFATIGRP